MQTRTFKIYIHVHVLEVKNLEVSLCLELHLNCLIFLLSCCRLSNIFGIFCFADSVCMDNFGRHCHCILTHLFFKLAKENVRSTNTQSLKICFSFKLELTLSIIFTNICYIHKCFNSIYPTDYFLADKNSD